ncbi:MAG TPA: PhoPQ-activated protein PqaA family protein, partial [Armatimonadota bacterium]|nr:PhoPQ-activated protein PqaA family protein [Armatimonadota bacterium]
QGITWTHRVQVVVPAQMDYPAAAVLVITGGTAGRDELMYLSIMAGAIGAPIVVLGDIPNQPLFNGLNEDSLIAFTFAKYLETGDPTWPLLFPMTKAAVRAMDAIEEYTAQAWPDPVRDFVVTGASKRGWTTWFTGAVAPGRIRGIAPMVYDNLNLAAQMRHQIEAWGDYSPMIHDYTERGLPDLLHTEYGLRLAAMVDPYSLRRRITMPKLTITGTNDPYWPLDAANLYFDEMVGPNYILYVPNSGHGLEDMMRVATSEVGFFLACTGRAPLPRPQWEFEGGRYLKLHVRPGGPVAGVSQWTAYAETRDFRKATWTEEPAIERDGEYLCRLLPPESGYAAIFGEMDFDADGREFPLSTNVRIISADESL